MNFKRIAPIVTAISFIATVGLTSCGHDPMMDEEIEIPEEVTTIEVTTENTTEESTEEETEAPTKAENILLESGGDTFTVVAWNKEDAPFLIANWLDIDPKVVLSGDEIKTPNGTNVVFKSLDTSGFNAAEEYERMLYNAEDVDVYLCESDWAMKFMNSSLFSAPMYALDIEEDDLEEMYPYTIEQCKNEFGELMGVSPTASPGCFAYRSDLAKDYLGVSSPEEMQATISDWECFTQAATIVAEKSGGKTSLVASVDDMWQAYSSGLKNPLVVDNQLNISEEIREFAEMSKKLWECGGVSQNSQWTDEWYEAGTNDKTIGYFAPSWGFLDNTFLMGATEGKGMGKWALCDGPQPFSWGGYVLVVNPLTDNGVEAHDFLTSSIFDYSNLIEGASRTASLPNNIPVTEYLIDSEFSSTESIKDHFINGQDYLTILDRNAKAVDLKGKLTEYDSEIKAVTISAIFDYLRNDESWDDTVSYIEDHVYIFYPELIK